MKYTACVSIRDPAELSWLGRRRVFEWTLEALTKVRGIGLIACYAAPQHNSVLKNALQKYPEVEFRVPLKLQGRNPAVEFRDDLQVDGILAIVRPLSPFLAASTIETCFEMLESGECAVCRPVRRIMTVANELIEREQMAQVPLRGLSVIKLDAITTPARLATVPASTIEALDIGDPGDRTIIEVLANSGTV